MKGKFMLLAAACAVLSILFAACEKEPVWTNVKEKTRESVTGETTDVTEIVTGAEGKTDAKTGIRTDIKAGSETDMETATDSETDTKTNIKTNTNSEPDTETGDSTGNSGSIVIYICGAVTNPGVYELPAESRVIQAIEAAGGLLEDADPFLVNQARILEDGEQIRILTREEAKQVDLSDYAEGADTGQNDSSKEEKININTADVDTLMTLPGIGQAKAEAIVEYRKNSGGFQRIEDIMNISGIKEAVFTKIKEKITVS